MERSEAWVYDIETYPDFFCVVAISTLTEEVRIFEISKRKNDLEDMREFFQNRWFVGYNNKHFDDPIVAALCMDMKGKLWSEITERAVGMANHIISGGFIDKRYKYQRLFASMDIMQIIRVGAMTAALKAIAINIKWPKIQEMPISPNEPVGDREDEVIYYCTNDVGITLAWFKELIGDINLRAQITYSHGINVMSESESGIGLKILESQYSALTGQHLSEFKEQRSYRSSIICNDILAPNVAFETEYMKVFLDEIRESNLVSNAHWPVDLGGVRYDMAKGGLHSTHPEAKIYEAEPGVSIIDADVGSYYPRLMVCLPAYPEHLHNGFPDLIKQMLADRLKFKHSDPVRAKVMKVASNSAYGRFGSQYSWLYDPKAMYRVAINGQLYLLMLIEALTEAGFKVFYGNTDGITTFVPDEKKDEYYQICKKWEEKTGLTIPGVDAPVLEFSEFSKFFIRDVNNYLVLKTDGSTKAKGDYDRYGYKNPMRSFDAPVVAHALHEYWINGKDIKETIFNHDDPYDFCMSQRMGQGFEAYSLDQGQLPVRLQRTNRFLVGTEGVELFKMTKEGKQRTSFVSGELCILTNDMESVTAKYPNGIPIKRSFYLIRALREMHLMAGNIEQAALLSSSKKSSPRQSDLFGDPHANLK